MTKYTEKKFSVAVGSDAYRDNFDRIFRKPQLEFTPEFALRAAETEAGLNVAAGVPSAEWTQSALVGSAARHAEARMNDHARVAMLRAAEQHRSDVEALKAAKQYDLINAAIIEHRRDSDARGEDRVRDEALLIEQHRNWFCDRHGEQDCGDCWQDKFVAGALDGGSDVDVALTLERDALLVAADLVLKDAQRLAAAAACFFCGNDRHTHNFGCKVLEARRHIERLVNERDAAKK